MAALWIRRILSATTAVVSLAACGSGGQPDGYGLADPGTITAGVTAGDAPFVSPDATGKPVGLLVDLNDVIAQRMGLGITYRMTTVSAGLALVTAGQLDMLAIGMLPTSERKKSVDFTKPFYLASDDVVVRTGSAVKAAGDLAGKRVGAGLGSAQADFVTAKVPAPPSSRSPPTARASPSCSTGTSTRWCSPPPRSPPCSRRTRAGSRSPTPRPTSRRRRCR